MKLIFKSISVIILIFYQALEVLGQGVKLGLPVGHTSSINSATFSPDGTKVVTASDDNTAKLFHVATGKLVNTLQVHTSCVRYVTSSPDETKVVTTSQDKTAKLFDTNRGVIKNIYT